MKTYKKNCPKCRMERNHRIYKIQRNRGIKLQCLSCAYIHIRYYNVKNLKEVVLK